MVVFGLDDRAPDVDVVLEATPEYFVAPPLPLLALFCALDVALESSLRVGLSLFGFELFGDDVKNTLRSLLTSLHGAATRACDAIELLALRLSSSGASAELCWRRASAVCSSCARTAADEPDSVRSEEARDVRSMEGSDVALT